MIGDLTSMIVLAYPLADPQGISVVLRLKLFLTRRVKLDERESITTPSLTLRG